MVKTQERIYGPLTATLAGFLLTGCGSDPATDSGDIASTAGTETSSGGVSGGTALPATTTGTAETGSGSSTGSADETTGTTGTDTDDELALCDPEDFSADSAVSISDPRCNGGDRCDAAATCVLDSTSGPDARTGRWRYEFLCAGDWTDIDAEETTPLVDAVVSMSSARELDLGDGPFEYSMSTDYADRFGGIDFTNNTLSLGDTLFARDVSSEASIGAAGLATMTFEEVPCDPAEVTWIAETCAWPRGLVGPGPDGAEVHVVNDIAIVGDWLVSSEGWESCGDYPGAYRRELEVSMVLTSRLVR